MEADPGMIEVLMFISAILIMGLLGFAGLIGLMLGVEWTEVKIDQMRSNARADRIFMEARTRRMNTDTPGGGGRFIRIDDERLFNALKETFEVKSE